MSPALAAQSVNHWTAREVLWLISSYILEFVKCLFIQWMLTYFHRRSLSERYYIIIASLQQNVNVTYGLSGLKLCLPSLNFIFSFICVCDVYINRYVKVTQSCLTLCNPLDHIVHGILQARILEWLAVSFSSRFFPTQGLNPGLSCIAGGFLPAEPQGKPRSTRVGSHPFSSRSSRPRN